MAPLTRSSNPFGSNAGIFSPPQPSTADEPDVIEIDGDDDEPVNEEEGSEVDNDEEIEDEEYEESDNEPDAGETTSVLNGHNIDFTQLDGGANPPDLFTSAGAREALHPLRRTADRVTRQIEAFAEKLDKFKQKEARPAEFESFQAAYQLVKSYHTLTKDAMQDLSKQRTLKRAKLGLKSQRAKLAAPDPATKKIDDELARLRLEADTWELLLNLIGISDPLTRNGFSEAANSAFQNLHRYSSDRQIWEQFINADHYATECLVIMKWLEDTADFGVRQVEELIADLEGQAERGQGYWTHGWLYTKEAIKGQKRLRAWPRPLEPNDPGITVSLLNSESQETLVTQLDPDAVTRQKQTLQKQDLFNERATWATCWKMLRCGENWTKIREWAQARLENWRAVSLCGSSVDASFCGEMNTPVDDSTARMANFRLQSSWRASCSALSRNPNVDDFQRAVYALLCGETQPAYSVCRSWDDFLYVHLNSILIARYQGFCRQLQRKLNYSPTVPVAFVPEVIGHTDLLNFLQHLKTNEIAGSEARNPYRLMQTAIIGKSFDKYFDLLAKSVSRVAAGRPDRSAVVPDLSPNEISTDLLITAEDEDALRIASHIYIVARSLGYVRTDTKSVDTASVNVIGHISTLEDAGVYDMIPLYASLLPSQLAHSVLGKILIAVVEPRERKQQVKLMDRYGIDIEAVLDSQWEWVWHKVSAIEHPRAITRYSKIVSSPGGNRDLAPVKKDYIGIDVSLEDEQIIRSLEWLRYIDGQWGKICRLGSLAYRRFYLTGKLAAARELSRRMNLSDISQKSFGFDIADFPSTIEDGVEAKVPEPSSPTRSRMLSHRRQRSSISSGPPSGNEQNILYVQSELMRDLEKLITAFDVLEKYAFWHNKVLKCRQRRDSGSLQELSENLQDAMNEASYLIDELLTDCLIGTEDEKEIAEMVEIRQTYIPELLLEFHNAVYWASYTISTDYLVQCLNLATQVADNEHLTSCFMNSKRMCELVDVVAIASRRMVELGSKRDKRTLTGEVLGIWHVEPDGEQDEEFHDFVRQARQNAASSNAV